MFRLVGVAGDVRGKKFSLDDGENIFGSDMGADHQITSKGISKKHFSLLVNEEFISMKDLGSSNGTFVNNKIIQEKSLREGDVISIPGASFKLIKVQVKKIKKQTYVEEKEEVPKSLFGKVSFYFKNKFMPMIFSMNQGSEWKNLISIFLAATIALVVFISVSSVLDRTEGLVLSEVINRVKQHAEEVSRRNSAYLYQNEFDQINLNFLEREKSVVEYYLLDRKGIVIKSTERKNVYVNHPFTVEAKQMIESKNDYNYHYVENLGEGRIGVAKGIFARNLESQRDQVVGVISIVFNPESLIELENLSSVSYLEALLKSAIIGFLCYLLIYFLTQKHLDVLIKEANEVLQGNKNRIEKKMLFEDMLPLEAILNQSINQLNELKNGDEVSFDSLESDDDYIASLSEIVAGYPGAGMVLNAEKQIKRINQEAEDLIGIRENLSLDQDLSDIIRDQSLVAKIISLCDQSSDEMGANCEEIGDISGTEYTITVSSLMGKDGYAKAHIIGFKQA